MSGHGTSLDFVFSNLISGKCDNATVMFAPSGEKLLLPEGNRLTIFDVARGQSLTHDVEHPASITHCAISGDGNYIITSDSLNNVIITQVGTGGIKYKRKFKKPITALAFAPGKIGFAVACSNKLTLYAHPSNVTALKPFVNDKRVGGHYDSIRKICFSPDGKYFTTCSDDMTIRLFMIDASEDFVPITLAGHRGKPLFAVFIENDSFISLGADGTLFTWRIEEDQSITVISKRRLDEDNFETPKKRFQNITAADCNGSSIVAGFMDGSFKVYTDGNPEDPIHSSSVVTFSSERVSTIAISKKYAAIISSKLGELVIWDIPEAKVAQRTMSHFGGVTCFDYSPNGIVVATGGDDGKLKIWDTQTGSCLMTFAEHDAPVNDVVFGESGRTVVTASFDGTCKAFDVVRGRVFRTFKANEHTEFARVTMDSSNEFVAACGRGAMVVYLFSLSTGKLLEELTGHEGPISSLAFTPFTKLVSGSWDGTSRVWDFLDSHSSIAYEARGEVTDVAVSPDGKMECIATSTGRILMYDLTSDEYIGEIDISLDARGGKRLEGTRSAQNTQWYFDSIDFSPDGNYIVCGGRSKYVCVYNVKSKLLMRRIPHTVNTEYSGVEGYIKEYHGSGKAQQIIESTLGKKPIIEASARSVRWCPTGRGFSAATPEGLLVYISADEKVVDPIELESDVTPAAVEQAVNNREWVRAIVMSIRLGHTERQLLLHVLTNVPVEAIEFVSNHIPSKYASDFIQFLADSLKNCNQVELLVRWIKATLRFHSRQMLKEPNSIPSSHLLQKSITYRIEQVKKVSTENLDLLNFLCSQPNPL